jgi:hypothetical protein
MNKTMGLKTIRSFLVSRNWPAAVFLGLIALCAVSALGQQAATFHQLGPYRKLTADQERILARAREILKSSGRSESEQAVRLQVIKAVLSGGVIRPDDDYPEARNPKYWTLVNDCFFVAPGESPADAISDLWVVHDHDGVPIPRIRCFKYSTLALIQGHIQNFRDTGNTAGLEALNRLMSHRLIPQGLPNGGDNLLWKRRLGNDNLLPGDQVWVDNPFFDRGRELIRKEYYRQEIREGKAPEQAVVDAANSTEALCAGEEGSNVFCLGDDKVIRGATSLSRLARVALPPGEKRAVNQHEQIFTPMIFTVPRFQEHMIDDNYSSLACLRADPASVRPEDFKIERVRSPIGPENLLRYCADEANGVSICKLIDDMASHNKAPRLVAAGDGTVPLFGDDYDWAEQKRVRSAIEAAMRTKSDDLWWKMRSSEHDDRYVFTATRDGVARNFTVGELCGDIVDLRLCLGFTSHLPSVPGRLPAGFKPEDEFHQHEAEWACQRKPLYAMQAALCDRAAELWTPILGTLPGSDGQSHVYSDVEKATFAAAMKKESAELNKSKKARYEEVVVTWLPAPSGWEGFDAERAREARQEHEAKTAKAN